MPTPITAFADAAAKYGDVDPDDIVAVQRWYAEELPRLPAETIEKVLHELLEQEGAPAAREIDPVYPESVPIPSLGSSPAALPPSLIRSLQELLRRLVRSRKSSSE